MHWFITAFAWELAAAYVVTSFVSAFALGAALRSGVIALVPRGQS